MLGAIALVATLAFLLSWTAFTVLVCALALAAMSRSRLSSWLSESFGESAARWRAGPGQRLSRLRLVPPRRVSTVILGGLGVLIAVWWVGVGWWSADNTYYLNKAAHFAASPTSFPVRDYMYGIAGATHYPYGDILSAFEPLLGTASALSGVSVSRLLFQLSVPLSMLLVPFAARYAARGLDLRRANLVGGFAAASVLLMTATNTTSLFATASYGKTVGQLVGIPVVIGATAALLKRRDPGTAVRAMLAWVCAVGLSPSLAVAALLIVASFTAAGLWDIWQTRSDGSTSQLPSLFWLSLPFVSLCAYSLVALVLLRNAGSSQLLGGFHSGHPQQAWERALIGGPRGDPVSDGSLSRRLDSPVAARGLREVCAARGKPAHPGALRGGVGTVVVQPDRESIVGRQLLRLAISLGLPIGLLIGIALAHIDARRTLGLLTVVAAIMGLGLSGPDLSSSFVFKNAVDVRHAPVWPWQAGIPTVLRRTAESVVDATPEGGRFLAPPNVEEIATAIQIERFPVYARVVYATAVGAADSVPDDFFPKERVFLGQAMEGKSPALDADGWRRALARVDVATVCIDKTTAAGLRQVVTQTYVPAGSAGLCEIWSRPRA